MASNKDVDFRKIENFIRSKGKTANSRKPWKMRFQHTKGKDG